MEASCSPLMRILLWLLVAPPDFSSSQNAGFPRVAPDRQQLFRSESLAVSCEGLQGLSGWRVMRRTGGGVKTCSPDWSSSIGPCDITDLLPAFDNGEYWCEKGEKTSNTVNITVTEGPVVLESPVHPVAAGGTATLSCRAKQATSDLTADFFKDGHLMESSSSLDLIILSVSKSNEGVYKCSIPGAGESPGSWLTVGASDEAPHPGPELLLPLGVGVGVFLVALLLSVALLIRRKRPPASRESPPSPSSFRSSSSPETVYEEARAADPRAADPRAADPIHSTYGVVKKPRRGNDNAESFSFMPVYHTLSLGEA